MGLSIRSECIYMRLGHDCPTHWDVCARRIGTNPLFFFAPQATARLLLNIGLMLLSILLYGVVFDRSAKVAGGSWALSSWGLPVPLTQRLR